MEESWTEVRGSPLSWPPPPPQECPWLPLLQGPLGSWALAPQCRWDWEPGLAVFHDVRVHPGFKVRDGGGMRTSASDSRGSRYRTRPQSGVVKACPPSAISTGNGLGDVSILRAPRKSQAGVAASQPSRIVGGRVLETTAREALRRGRQAQEASCADLSCR